MDAQNINPVQLFLENCGLRNLWHNFNQQKIDELDILKELNDNQINILTENCIGDKIKLKRAIAAVSERQGPSTELFDSSTVKKAKFDETFPQVIDFEDSSLSTKQVDDLPIVVLNDNVSDIKQLHAEDDQSHATASATTLTYETSGYVTGISSSSNNDGLESKIFNVSKFDFKSFLRNDVLGSALLQKSQREGLTSTDRDRLAELLIKNIVNLFGKLSNEGLQILANEIHETFPNEKSSTYFVPAVPKSKSTRNISERSRGKLADKQRNLLFLVNSLNKEQKATVENQSNVQHAEAISQEARDSFIWLKKNLSPTDEVLKYWKVSYLVRKLEVTETIQSFVEKWPILKTPLAPELIRFDFEKIHPQDELLDLESAVNDFFQHVLNIRKSCLTAADNTILELLNGELTTDSISAIQLYLLPALVPPKGRTQISKVSWKPSISETRDTFIVHAKIPGDIGLAKKQQIDSMFQKGLTVQPYLVLVGPNLSNITGCLVIVNDWEYKCISVLDALDFCFKFYHILDARYPFPCSHLWYLIQWRLYKYYSKSDPKIPYINDLL